VGDVARSLKARNSNIEIRNKFEIQKKQIQNNWLFGILNFGAFDLFRISIFGFRILKVLTALLPQRHAAAQRRVVGQSELFV
jgi:hypothetical protein